MQSEPSSSVAKGLPADLVVQLQMKTEFFVSKHKQGFIAHSHSLSPSHCPDMTEILLKRM